MFLSLVGAAVETVLGWLPESVISPISSTIGAAAPLFSWVGWLNQYLPITEALIVLGVQLGAWVAWLGFHGVVWVLQRARVIG